MKGLKKFVIILGTGLIVGLSSVSSMEAFAAMDECETIQPRADIIEWRYKTENGKIYKRKFNYSKNKWVGKWIFVANVVED